MSESGAQDAQWAGCECGGEHVAGVRAWCLDCSEWCYPDNPCEVYELRKFQADVTEIVESMAHQPPDHSQADYELWERLALVVLGHV